MLNKENYVPWSSRLLRYAKSRPNGKLIHNSILNGPYVRRMILEPGDAERDVNMNETFHEQTDDELSEKELKQIEADDQAIQTILLGLPEDIYAAVDSGETAQEIWLRPEWSRHVTIVHQTKDLHTADYTQLYDFLNYNQKEGNILITRVYFVEGLGYNLFSVGQFCDSDLEVAFRRNACFVRNLEGVDLLKGDRSTNLYTINLHEMASASPICLMARASSIKSWLWHQRLSHLNFDTINDLAINDLIAVLKVYFDSVGISHQMSSVRTPQQNGVVERKNRTLVQAARTMLIFSRAPLFLWAEAIATACFTQNRSIIHRRFNKTPYELINGRKPDISFLHVFGALCYPKNDREDIGKLGAKGDIGFFIGYSADSCAYKIYNHRRKKLMETMNVSFDELSAMAFEQRSSKLGLQSMTSGQISSGLDLTYAPSTITKQQPTKGELDLLFEAMYDDYFGGQPSATMDNVSPAQEPQVRQTSTASTTIADNVPIPTNSSSHATNIPITSQDVEELNPNAMVDGNT
nr:integrase, catalytic region, zinc finger, CCHC-type, peptidase aspartic, catalytic [Tanacetum cinerariifolium]